MKKLILLLLLILVGCSKEPINIDEVLIERNDGYYTKDTNRPYSGPVFTVWENGQLEMEVNLKNGKPDGLWKSYHKNGQLRQEGTYKNGKQNGLFTGYHQNGRLESVGTIKDGKPDGFVQLYWENGELMTEGTFNDGKKEGPFKIYHWNGQLKSEQTYKDGEPVEKNTDNSEGRTSIDEYKREPVDDDSLDSEDKPDNSYDVKGTFVGDGE